QFTDEVTQRLDGALRGGLGRVPAVALPAAGRHLLHRLGEGAFDLAGRVGEAHQILAGDAERAGTAGLDLLVARHRRASELLVELVEVLPDAGVAGPVAVRVGLRRALVPGDLRGHP